MVPDDFAVRRIHADDDLESFKLSGTANKPLRHFLRRRAKCYDLDSLGRSYVLVDRADGEKPGRVWGFVTLVASQMATTDGNHPGNAEWGKFDMPGVKLARMAIDDELRGRGAGRNMIRWVIAHVLDLVCVHLGCRLLITDAKESAVGFYKKNGFHILDTEDNKNSTSPTMFIDLMKLGRGD